MKLSNKDLVRHLQRQLLFLRNSSTLFDSGCHEEAIRIAVVIRVLFHRGNDHSLLDLMGLKDSLQLATTAKPMLDVDLTSVDYFEFLSGITFGEHISYNPVPDDAPTVPFVDWWHEPVLFWNHRIITREKVVLAAANKDGGAHVGDLNADIKALQKAFWIKTEATTDGLERTIPLENNHFRILRRIANELLVSKGLLAIAEE